MNRIKRFFLRFWFKKKVIDFPINKELHRQQLLQALEIITEPELRECARHLLRPFVKQIAKEFGLTNEEIKSAVR